MGNWPHWVCTMLALMTLAACTPATRAPVAPQTAVDVRAEAFRAGVRATLESYATQYLDNDFPYYSGRRRSCSKPGCRPRSVAAC